MADERVSRTYKLPKEVAGKITHLCRARGQTAGELVAAAIMAYYEQAQQDPVIGAALATLEQVEAEYGQPLRAPRGGHRRMTAAIAPRSGG